MTNCQICALQNQQIRQTVKNVIKMIKDTQIPSKKSQKQIFLQDSFCQLLNYKITNLNRKQSNSSPCQDHLSLKYKIITFLQISETRLQEKCKQILLRSAKNDHMLYTIISSMQKMPQTIPELIQLHKENFPILFSVDDSDQQQNDVSNKKNKKSRSKKHSIRKYQNKKSKYLKVTKSYYGGFDKEVRQQTLSFDNQQSN